MADDLEAEVTRRLHAAGLGPVHAEWLSQRDWWGVISFATTTDYWRCFDVLEPLMTDLEYATTVRELWCATNGLPPGEAERRLQQHGRQISRDMWMNETDREAFDGLPESVTIYRGCRTGGEGGWCWTLTRDTAEHFAFGLGADAENGSGVVLTGSVAKHDIIALFSGNWEEQEVIVPGRLVTVTHVSESI